jgi:hypothetical protein
MILNRWMPSSLIWSAALSLSSLLLIAPIAGAQDRINFEPGTSMFSAGASYVAGIDERADIGTASAAMDWFVLKNFSLGVEVSGLGVSQSGPDTGGAAVAGQFRHHLIRWNSGTAFIDGAFGPVEMADRVPAGGTRFNFISRIGPGVMLKVDQASYLMLGARFWHLSNAQIEGAHRNPAINGVQVYVGIAHSW